MTEEKNEEQQQDRDEEAETQRRNVEVLSGFRGPRSGINERLVCQSLFQATFTDEPNKKINHLCSACLNCSSLMKNDVEAKKQIDEELIKKIYAINRSFQSAYATKIDNYGNLSINIPFSLEHIEENFLKYVKPWSGTIDWRYYSSQLASSGLCTVYIVKHSEEHGSSCGHVFATFEEEDFTEERFEEIQSKWKNKDCPGCGHYLWSSSSIDVGMKKVAKLKPEWEWFFEVTRCLGQPCFRELRERFHVWAFGILENAKMLIGSYVSAGTYDEVVKLLSRGKEEKDSQKG